MIEAGLSEKEAMEISEHRTAGGLTHTTTSQSAASRKWPGS
jgi:hypothetical protein